MKVVKVYSGEIGNLFIENICDVESFISTMRERNATIGEHMQTPASQYDDADLISRFEHGIEMVTFPPVEDLFGVDNMFGFDEPKAKSIYVQVSELNTFRVQWKR